MYFVLHREKDSADKIKSKALQNQALHLTHVGQAVFL